LSGVWCGSKNGHQKDMFLKETGLLLNHVRHNSPKKGGGEPIWPLNKNKNKNPHFDNDSDIHMSSVNYEGNGYGHDLGLLIISRWLHVSYPTRSGCRDKSIWFYLMVVVVVSSNVQVLRSWSYNNSWHCDLCRYTGPAAASFGLCLFLLTSFTDPGKIDVNTVKSQLETYPFDNVLYMKKSCPTCGIPRWVSI
jgi:hypothetical protein